MCLFYLGTSEPSWLQRLDVPLFLSRRRLARLKKLPRAQVDWVLDSGAYSELNAWGRWLLSPRRYLAEVKRYWAEVGRLQWISCMDWVCEPVIRHKTGLTVAQHQQRSLDNYLELKALAPD